MLMIVGLMLLVSCQVVEETSGSGSLDEAELDDDLEDFSDLEEFEEEELDFDDLDVLGVE